MKKMLALIIIVPLLGGPARGQDLLGPIQEFGDELTEPQTAEQPRARAPEVPVVDTPEVPPVPRPRPPDRPVGAEEDDAEAVTEPEGAETPADEEPEPAEADTRVYQAACPAVVMGLVEATMAPPLSEGICGERSPLTVTAVLSRGRMVPLSVPVTTNCQMASALPSWVADVDGYAETMLESRLAQVDTGTSYQCRDRNGGAEEFTSEHGFANAVDVVGFTLEDGRKVSVVADWLPAAEPAGRLLRLAHDVACGGFMTVLGPEANEEHRDHLHLDMGCHGERCVARVCE